MDNIYDKLDQLYTKVSEADKLALGYPVNRCPVFDVNYSRLGISDNSLASIYLNNIASPFSLGKYTCDNSKLVEQDLFRLLSKHYNQNDDDKLSGYVTSGGTESNFVALWWHKKFLRNTYSIKPIVVYSSDCHYSIPKVLDQLDLDGLVVPALADGSYNYDLLDTILAQIDHNIPLIFVAVFGYTTTGSIDDVARIHSIITKHKFDKYKIHLDGAIYGALIPYIQPYDKIKIFDLVDTLCFSNHKFLGSYRITGTVLLQDTYLKQIFANASSIYYIQDVDDFVFSGSRDGFNAVEAYLIMENALSLSSNGQTNLLNKWQECLALANWFHLELTKIIALEDIIFNPNQLSIIFRSPRSNKDELCMKYGLMPVLDKIGIYVLPRSTRDKLTMFINDYINLDKDYDNE